MTDETDPYHGLSKAEGLMAEIVRLQAITKALKRMLEEEAEDHAANLVEHPDSIWCDEREKRIAAELARQLDDIARAEWVLKEAILDGEVEKEPWLWSVLMARKTEI